MTITRYDLYQDQKTAWMEEGPQGDYVDHDDHVAALQVEKDLTRQLENLVATFRRWLMSDSLPHTKACLDYAAKTMNACGSAFCIADCPDRRRAVRVARSHGGANEEIVALKNERSALVAEMDQKKTDCDQCDAAAGRALRAMTVADGTKGKIIVQLREEIATLKAKLEARDALRFTDTTYQLRLQRLALRKERRVWRKRAKEITDENFSETLRCRVLMANLHAYHHALKEFSDSWDGTMEKKPRIKMTHGTCCCCVACGRYHDECVCEHNAIVDYLAERGVR